MCEPFLIRHWGDGREFELRSMEAFEAKVAKDPSWYIASGKNSVFASDLPVIALPAPTDEGIDPGIDELDAGNQA